MKYPFQKTEYSQKTTSKQLSTQGVVENMPKLKWSKAFEDGLYIAISSFGVSYRIKFAYNEFHLFCNSVHISCYISLSDAKQAANEHYKKQIKKALGL